MIDDLPSLISRDTNALTMVSLILRKCLVEVPVHIMNSSMLSILPPKLTICMFIPPRRVKPSITSSFDNSVLKYI